MIAAAVVAAVLFGSLVENAFIVTLAGYTCAFALFALSINIMLGGLGEVPLGQCIFFGIGAYGAGIGTIKLGLPFEAAVVLAMLVSIVAAAMIGWLTLRLTGAYFAIVSWGMSGVAMVAALNLSDITGGPLGMFGFPPIKIGPFLLAEPRNYFFATAAILLLVVLVLSAVRTSKFGSAIESIRQNQHLAQSVGVNVFRERLKAFILSAPIAALGGALCVPYTQIVTPEVFSVANTVDALLMVLIGGTGLLVGPIIGAVIFSIIPYYLSLDPNVRILIFSAAIIVIMVFAPGGLHQIATRLFDRMRGGRGATDAT
ncbi:branched-chain amino acid ABC transporter permease [Afipia sp. Root123D2]|uniref:branched-chain amino acid ABC transporter permease n=1 Tax=Afipia sp. Root123D2 TaxID=1736436 RepID=UPI0006F5213F|nr:branched-chain amino acid ABC transporter permease [Afipia sp. Root123D2]KQW20457.1 branched-chain amino acid ABC transporter permease [Afipia sp. Root123D2]